MMCILIARRFPLGPQRKPFAVRMQVEVQADCAWARRKSNIRSEPRFFEAERVAFRGCTRRP